MDAPTEKQFDVPVQQRNARDVCKALDGAKRWSSKITGLMISGLGILAYVTRSGLGSGADLSCTVLYLGLLHLVASGRPIGEALFVLLDNTTADNKNNEVMFFLAWLVATGKVTEASFFCMQVGHTYSRIDQTFRTLIGHLLAKAIYTVPSLVHWIGEYLRAYTSLGCTELHCVWNWKAFFAPHVHERFTGFDTGQFGSGMHEFMLRKDDKGVVRMWVRASSQASSWLPAGEGMAVFKSIPVGHPQLKNALPDSKWKRDEVYSTVYAWMRYLPVLPEVLVSVKADWESRFSTLPQPDGDISSIPASQPLEWADLPTRNASMRLPPLSLHGLSSGLENPDVCPMTFHGRSAGDREYEVAHYQQQLVQQSSKAIFQAHFLFVMGSTGVELQRVANGLCLADALAEDIVFSTSVLEHHPQVGLRGFWGHFNLKLNPHFDVQDKKSGNKYVRQLRVTRADILVYNVQIFEPPAPAGHPTKKLLRVKAESLRALAEVSSEQPHVSSEGDADLPDTHGGGAGGGKGTRRGKGKGGRGRDGSKGKGGA